MSINAQTPQVEIDNVPRGNASLESQPKETGCPSPTPQLYAVGPTGVVQMAAKWKQIVEELCEAVIRHIGECPSVSYWPYRIGAMTIFALDVCGNKGDAHFTIMVSGTIQLPGVSNRAVINDYICHVSDATDAFYLSAAVVSALKLPSSGILAGPR